MTAENRPIVIKVRMSHKETQGLDMLASRLGCTRSDLVRKVIAALETEGAVSLTLGGAR